MSKTAGTKPNRMDRRRNATRQKILSATVKLITKKGVEKTTLDDITEQADLGRRTFYYHFSGKEECIQAAAASVFQRHGESAEALADSDDPAFVVALSVQVVLGAVLNEAITGCLLEYPRVLGGAFVDALGGFVRRDIAHGVDTGDFQPAVAGDMLDRMIMWSIVGLIIETFEQKENVEHTLRDYAQTFLMILGVPSALAKDAADQAHDSLAQ